MARRHHKHRMPGWLRWTLGIILGILVTVFAFSLYGYIQEHFSNRIGIIVSASGIILVGALLGWGATKRKLNNRL